MKKLLLFFLVLIFAVSANAQVISLNGKWSFAIDPTEVGEQNGWHQPWSIAQDNSTLLPAGWDQVNVPHCWSLDTRYNFIGKAWYRKGFKLPEDVSKSCVRLNFEAVFYTCRIFLNGDLVGIHEGGYTPFSLDITQKVKYPDVNFLVVEADNSWDQFSVPGARVGSNPNTQLFPWYEFGGITRDIALEITSKVYISKQKIETVPDLKAGNASIRIITWIENKTYSDTTIMLQPSITARTNQTKVLPGNQCSKTVSLQAWTQEIVIQEVSITPENTLLWDFDNPNLYDVESILLSDENRINTYKTYFGIREFKIAGTQLLLNGNPVRVAGANRHCDHPSYGSTEPAELAALDMGLQRNGNMVMARLNHTPTSRHFYQWADENGSLIIAEIPNWQIPPVLMANAEVREVFRHQMQEMVESCWNSPSIIAWSTGNEYQSWTPEGDDWTRFQMEKYRELDSTRLMTFISVGAAAAPQNLLPPHDSYRHCDFLCLNGYQKPEQFEKSWINLHQKYPNIPIFISECGLRADQVKNEQERVDYLKDITNMVKRNPYVSGFSFWSFNDYLSRFSGTNPSGYREWGIVDPWRNPRGLYLAFQTELSPVLVNYDRGSLTIKAKADFPSYTLKNYKVVIKSGEKVINEYSLPVLNPGDFYQIKMARPSVSTTIVIENPGGFRVYDSGISY